MIAADSSTWIAFIEGDPGEDVRRLDAALGASQLLMAPVVLTEVLSDSTLPPTMAKILINLPSIEITTGYWQRAGELRAQVLA